MRPDPDVGEALARWLERIGREIPANVDRGLAHVARVASRLGVNPPAPHSVVVAGTNGKGSTVAVLEQVLEAAGLVTGTVTSPHLRRFNERIHVGGREADDETIVAAFEAVEAARGDDDLSYFEFAVLAAFVVHRRAGVAASVLEIGLGGRLDAVNVVDGDVTVIASIGIDHEEILGKGREAIGAEKAGILRPGVPLVFGGPDPPASVLGRAEELRAPVLLAGRDFGVDTDGYWTTAADGSRRRFARLDCAAAPANAATALQAAVLGDRAGSIGDAVWRSAAPRVRIPGRCEVARANGRTFVLDVGHNGDGAAFLAAQFRALFPGRRPMTVVGCLKDKDAAAIVAPLAPLAAGFCFADTETWRARPGASTREAAGMPGVFAGDLDAAIAEAVAATGSDDVILVCGSFDVVERTRRLLGLPEKC